MEASGPTSQRHRVFVTGGTGYVGRRLIRILLARGHEVRALARPGSERHLPPGAVAVLGNALEATSFAPQVAPADTLIHLVGIPHPAPWKGPQFRAVDLVSAKALVTAALTGGIKHFVYVSVAHPAPVMKAYIEVRRECEALIRVSGLAATILRPWYVLGPGHRWPICLLPIYWLLQRLPSTREAALRLGLLTLDQMVRALVWAVECPCDDIRVLAVQDIRAIQGG